LDGSIRKLETPSIIYKQTQAQQKEKKMKDETKKKNGLV
jgi:hypothetical protein